MDPALTPDLWEADTPPVATQEAGRYSFIVTLWREALAPYLGTRLVLVLVGLLADLYVLPLLKSNVLLPPISLNSQFPAALWLVWRRFDAGFYVDIAEHGYWAASTLQTKTDWIFLPLYPILIYPFGHLFGGSDTAFDIAGILVSNMAGLMTVIYLYLLVRAEFGARIASRSVCYLALFPTSFYLSAIYPESLFLALVIACIYYARRRRWWLAGVCGALASLARIQGFLLIAPVAWEYWQALSDRYAPLPDKSDMSLWQKAAAWQHSRLKGLSLSARELRNWFNLLAVALIPPGLVPFFIYSQVKTGDFLAAIHSQTVGWGRYFEVPWRLLAGALRHPLPPDAMNWNFWLLNIVVIFAFLAVIAWSWRRLPSVYTVFTLIMVLMPLSTANINSVSRYYLAVFPVFILLALWGSKHGKPVRHFLVISFFAALQAVFMLFFALGLPLIA